MEAQTVTMTQNNTRPVSPTAVRIPEWQQFPPEKRAELTRILAGMLIRQVQEVRGQHEQPS